MDPKALTPAELQQAKLARCRARHEDLYQSLVYAESIGMEGPPCKFCEAAVEKEYAQLLEQRASIEAMKKFKAAQ